MMKSAGQGKASFKKVQDLSKASIADGASSAPLRAAALAGHAGEYPSNLERDLSLKFRKDNGMWLQLYSVDTYVRRPGKGISPVKWSVLLPHELFSYLASDRPDAWHELFEVPQDFWKHVAEADDPWFATHPLEIECLRTHAR